MGKNLLIVTDLGTFKAYELQHTKSLGTPRLELLETFSPPEMDHRYANTVTTRAGRSAKGNVNLQSQGNNSDGESHNMETEKRRRGIKSITERLNHWLGGSEFNRCFLAAPEEINGQILEGLQPSTRNKIQQNLPRDLTRLPAAEILNHFDLVTSSV